MTTKPRLTLAIMLALPFGANATGPAPFDWDSDDDPVVATTTAPYATVTPEAHADEHIASTKYVIGAYNDLIAGMNRIDEEKQNTLIHRTNNGDDAMMSSLVRTHVNDVSDHSELVSGLAVKNAIDSVDSKIDNKRVEIYTTWENDSAKTQVAFVNAPAAQ